MWELNMLAFALLLVLRKSKRSFFRMTWVDKDLDLSVKRKRKKRNKMIYSLNMSRVSKWHLVEFLYLIFQKKFGFFLFLLNLKAWFLRCCLQYCFCLRCSRLHYVYSWSSLSFFHKKSQLLKKRIFNFFVLRSYT